MHSNKSKFIKVLNPTLHHTSCVADRFIPEPQSPTNNSQRTIRREEKSKGKMIFCDQGRPQVHPSIFHSPLFKLLISQR